MKRILFSALILALLFSSCKQQPAVVKDQEAFKTDYSDWKKERIPSALQHLTKSYFLKISPRKVGNLY